MSVGRIKHFQVDGTTREEVWRRGGKAWNVPEESQRVKFDRRPGTLKGSLGAKLKVVTGP